MLLCAASVFKTGRSSGLPAGVFLRYFHPGTSKVSDQESELNVSLKLILPVHFATTQTTTHKQWWARKESPFCLVFSAVMSVFL